jgi:hypothetical protein
MGLLTKYVTMTSVSRDFLDLLVRVAAGADRADRADRVDPARP